MTPLMLKWKQLGAINLLSAIGWFTSLIHYTQAVELGGRHIFAFHLACVLVCIVKIKQLRGSSLATTGPKEFDSTC